MSDEPNDVFPDLTAKPAEPPTAEQLINHAFHDLENNFIWLWDGDGWICNICAPNPPNYKLRKGADPDMHANQRSPDTHRQNMVWIVVEWFKANKLPLPGWPDAYRATRDAQLFCHICRGMVGAYTEEDGRKHDEFHRNRKQIVMRPNRLGQYTRNSRRPGRPHILDLTLRSRNEDYQGAGEASPDYSTTSFGDPQDTVRQNKPRKNDMEQFVHSQYSKDKVLYEVTEGERNDLREYMEVFEGSLWQQIPYEVLDRILEVPEIGKRTIACGVLEWHSALTLKRSGIRHCEVEECECNCHKPPITASDAELEARS